MSLNYDLTKVKKSEELQDGLLQTISFMSMFIEMGEITADNADEWLKRAHLWEFVNGQMSNRQLTHDDVTRMIGFRCNVITKTWLQFSKPLIKKYFDQGRMK